MRLKLPNGLLDGPDLFNFVEVDELRGKQQNYLVDKELLANYLGHIPKVLEDLIIGLETEAGVKWKGKISEAIYKLPNGDLETILVAIRRNTFGDRFYHQAQCEECGHVHKDMKLDLSTLEVKYQNVEEMLKPKVVTLPKAQVEVELKPTYLSDLFKVIDITSKGKNLITSYLTTMIKRIGDNTNVTSEDLEKLAVSDLDFLQDQGEEFVLEGTIDTIIEYDCVKCKAENKMKMNCYDPSFLVRTRVSMS